MLSWFSIKVGNTEVGLNTGNPKETPFAEKTAILDLFEDAFDRLLAAWVHRKLDAKKLDPAHGVLVVFIDDLDRCLPAKTVQVLEAIKLFLDKEGAVFVLGADIRRVQEAVDAHYKNTGMTGEIISDYIEKIIQLRFELPPIEMSRMENYLNEMKVGEAKLITDEWGKSWKLLITGAEINPRKVKTFMNDLSLQWAMLVNSGQAQGVNRQDFNAWQVLMRVAPGNFVTHVRERIDDVELRYKFVQEAIEWAKGNQDVGANYREYDGAYRLKRVLKQIAFTSDFNADRLDNFIHLAAPLLVEMAGWDDVEINRNEEKASAAEQEIIREREEVLEVKGIPREVRGITPREGVQTWGGLEFVRVPKGRFLMGSKEDNPLADDDEKLQYPVEIPHDYWMGRYPVTNEQYNQYVQAKGIQHPVKDGQKKKDHPVVNVSWLDCMAYCQWLNERHGVVLPSGIIFRLPTEAEWEKAARGEFGNEWPWGNEWDAKKCNTGEGGRGGTTPVGSYSPQGDSPYGAADMVGNVWEYTHSLSKGYPYKGDDGREDEKAQGLRVVRGGSFHDHARYARSAARSDDHLLHFAGGDSGFRVCVAPKLSFDAEQSAE